MDIEEMMIDYIMNNATQEEVKEFFTEEACSSISFVACGKTEIYDGYSLERVSESLDDARSELYVELSKDI